MFITFEGINGSGKTTQSKMLFEYLKQKNKKVILTKEPGGGNAFCQEIRKIICTTKDISSLTEMFLLFASRKEHIDKVIKPALSNGTIVICDRYIDSTFAYQCCDDTERIKLVNLLHKEIGGIMPDKTFFIDISVDESAYRLAPLLYTNSANIANAGYKKYDELSTDHMQKIVNMYHTIVSENQNRITSIDGTQSIEMIHSQIIKELGI